MLFRSVSQSRYVSLFMLRTVPNHIGTIVFLYIKLLVKCICIYGLTFECIITEPCPQCFHPLDAWQCSNGDVVFTDNLARNDVIRRLALPCGRCVGCRLERSRQWAVRCMHEASMHMFNSFVTLTYDDDHLPEYNSLN